MKTVLMARGVRPLRNGKPNAKLYPFFDQLSNLLKQEGYEVIELTKELPLLELKALVKSMFTTICCDSFLSHFCESIGAQAVVIFGPSDPKIFGCKSNINLFKSKAGFRKDQFKVWEDEPCNDSIWVTPEEILTVIKALETH
jgi:ADP-heptose:LPS heptosyltransferase